MMLGGIIIFSATALVGLTVFAHYADNGCDPLASGEITNANQVKISNKDILSQTYCIQGRFYC